jgi:branched-chain amino acid aminotransferase
MTHGTHDALDDPRNEQVLVYVNGEFVQRNEAKISVFDSGFLIGDGIWEGIRLHDGVLVFLDEHLDRLFQGARAIALDIGLSHAQLTGILYNLLAANNMHSDVHVRLMITRGTKKTPSQDPRLTIGGPNMVIIAEHKLANPAVKQTGISLFTSTVRRGSPDYLDPRLNCHSKLHEVIALSQALQAGADEALMLDIHGFVSTCNATNFFIVHGGEVWTSTGDYCLHGITRAKVIELCRANGIPVYQKNFSLTDAYDADEAFVTGTFGGLTPVHTIDGLRIGGGSGDGSPDGSSWPMTLRLGELYLDAIKRYVATTAGSRQAAPPTTPAALGAPTSSTSASGPGDMEANR